MSVGTGVDVRRVSGRLLRSLQRHVVGFLVRLADRHVADLLEPEVDRVGLPHLHAGAKDGVIAMAAAALEAMPNHVTDLRINELVDGIGHWTQQEAPDATNAAMLRFLSEVQPT